MSPTCGRRPAAAQLLDPAPHQDRAGVAGKVQDGGVERQAARTSTCSLSIDRIAEISASIAPVSSRFRLVLQRKSSRQEHDLAERVPALKLRERVRDAIQGVGRRDGQLE